MRDQSLTREKLIVENAELRRQTAERKRVEEDLRRSEDKWRSVAENAPLFVSIVGIRERVRLLKGKCHITSKTNEGTAVIVELPVSPQRQVE
jgi:hypothetical protein